MSITKRTVSTLQIRKNDFSIAIASYQVETIFTRWDVWYIHLLVLVAMILPSEPKTYGHLSRPRPSYPCSSSTAEILSAISDKRNRPSNSSVVTSLAGSMGDVGLWRLRPNPSGTDLGGASKHLEFNGTLGGTRLIAIPLHLGWVQTRVELYAIDQWHLALGAVDCNSESLQQRLRIVSPAEATVEKLSQVLTLEGKNLPW
jgi:hypothetical protein